MAYREGWVMSTPGAAGLSEPSKVTKVWFLGGNVATSTTPSIFLSSSLTGKTLSPQSQTFLFLMTLTGLERVIPHSLNQSLWSGECDLSDWLRPTVFMWVNSAQRTLPPKRNVGTVFTRSGISGCWVVNTGASPLLPRRMPFNWASNLFTWQHNCQRHRNTDISRCTPYTLLFPTTLPHTHLVWLKTSEKSLRNILLLYV